MKLAVLFFCLFQISTNPQETSKVMEIEFLGTYRTGRAPCEWLPDGSRRWANTTGFDVDLLVKGDVQVKYIEIAQNGNQEKDGELQEGVQYTVKITISSERFSALELGNKETIMLYQDPILKKEIMSIEKKVE